MKVQDKLPKIIAILLGSIVAGISFHALISVFFSSLFPMYSDIFKIWKEVVLGLTGVLVACLLFLRKKHAPKTYPTIQYFVAAFILVHVVMCFVSPQTYYQMIAGLMIDLRFIVFFVLCLIFVGLYPRYKESLLKIYAMAACIVVLFGFLQVTILPDDFLKHFGYSESTIQPYLTVDENPDYIRINSTLRGPNPLGVYIAGFIIVTLAYAARRHRTLGRREQVLLIAALMAGSVCLWFTYSRSALIMALLGVSIVGMAEVWRRYNAKYIIFACVLIIVGISAALFVAKDTYVVQHVIFHNNPDDANPINSDHQHEASLQTAIQQIVRSPLGVGVGTTGSASLRGEHPFIIESQYLFVAHEVGVLGLGLFIALFGTVLYALWRRRKDPLAFGICVAGIGIVVVGLVQPVFADDTVAFVWWGLAALALVDVKKGKNNDQKTA